MKSGDDKTGRVQIGRLDGRPLLSAIHRQMKSALESFIPGCTAAQAMESYCARAEDIRIPQPQFTLAVELAENEPFATMLFAASGYVSDEITNALESGIPAGMAGIVRLFQAHSRGRIEIQSKQLDDSSWAAQLHAARNYMCVHWRLGPNPLKIELLQAVPDTFFMALSERVFSPDQLEETGAADLRAFAAMLDNLEKAIDEEFPDDLPDVEFQTSWLFLGGQCAEVKWFLHFADLFALPPADLNLLLQETKKQGVYEVFQRACIGSLPTAMASLAKAISTHGIEEFGEKVLRHAASVSVQSQMEAEFQILQFALELDRDGKLNPPASLKIKFDKTIQAQSSPDLFDKNKALDDFTALLLNMPPRDLQFAVMNLPKRLLARALSMESHIGLFMLHNAISANTSANFRSGLIEEVRRAAAEASAAGKTALISPTRARLLCIDHVRSLADEKRISPAIHAADPDWLPDEKIQAVIEGSSAPPA